MNKLCLLLACVFVAFVVATTPDFLSLDHVETTSFSVQTPGSNLLDITSASGSDGKIAIVTRSNTMESVASVVTKNTYHDCVLPASASVGTLRVPRKGFFDNHLLITDNKEIFYYDVADTKATNYESTEVVRTAPGNVIDLVVFNKVLVVASLWRVHGTNSKRVVHLEHFTLNETKKTFESAGVKVTDLPVIDDIILNFNEEKVEVGLLVDNEIHYFDFAAKVGFTGEKEHALTIKDAFLYRIAGHYQDCLVGMYFGVDKTYSNQLLGLVDQKKGTIKGFLEDSQVIVDATAPAHDENSIAVVYKNNRSIALRVIDGDNVYPEPEKYDSLHHYFLNLSEFARINVHLTPTVAPKKADKTFVDSTVALVSVDMDAMDVLVQFIDFNRESKSNSTSDHNKKPMMYLLIIIAVVLVAVVALLVATRQKRKGYTSL